MRSLWMFFKSNKYLCGKGRRTRNGFSEPLQRMCEEVSGGYSAMISATTAASRQSQSTVKEVFDELKQKIEQVDNELKDQGRRRKTPIYKEYAPIIARFMPINFVCGELCKHFPKDQTLIRWALENKYKDLSKANADNTEEESSIHLHKVIANEGKNVVEQKALDIEIEKDGRLIQLKDKLKESEERNEKLHEHLSKQQVRIVRVNSEQCKKVAKLMGIPPDIIDTVKEIPTEIYEVIDGEDLWTIMDHYPTNEELEEMGLSI